MNPVAEPLPPASPPRPPPPRAARTKTHIGVAHVAVPLGAALSLAPGASPGIALLGGAAVGLACGNPFAAETRRVARALLALAVVGLGGAIDLRVVARVGLDGVAYTAIGIACCLAAGALLGRALRVPPHVALLVSVGTAICGGSAIAAVAPIVRPKEHDVTVALAIVFVLNAVALFAFPSIGHALRLDPARFGLWAALAIHDTSSVVGASMAYGGSALAVATTVKLARALWIVPVAAAIAAWVARRPGGDARAIGAPRARPPRPWFIAGFLALAALSTFVPALRPAGLAASAAAKHALSATLFAIGAGLTRPALKAVGVRPLIHGLALWAVVGAGSLAAILTGAIR